MGDEWLELRIERVDRWENAIRLEVGGSQDSRMRIWIHARHSNVRVGHTLRVHVTNGKMAAPICNSEQLSWPTEPVGRRLDKVDSDGQHEEQSHPRAGEEPR